MESLKMTDAELGDLARMLRKVNFFEPLTVGQLEVVIPYIGLLSFNAGETVFKQGDAGDALYIVYTGKVAVNVKKGFFSSAKAVAHLGAGEFFGEFALVSKEPRMATVACVEPTKAFRLLATDFDFIMKQNPELQATLEKVITQRKLMTSININS